MTEKTLKRVKRQKREREGRGKQAQERLNVRGCRRDARLSWEPLSYETRAAEAPRALYHHCQGSAVSFISASFLAHPILMFSSLYSLPGHQFIPVKTQQAHMTNMNNDRDWKSSYAMMGGTHTHTHTDSLPLSLQAEVTVSDHMTAGLFLKA